MQVCLKSKLGTPYRYCPPAFWGLKRGLLLVKVPHGRPLIFWTLSWSIAWTGQPIDNTLPSTWSFRPLTEWPSAPCSMLPQQTSSSSQSRVFQVPRVRVGVRVVFSQPCVVGAIPAGMAPGLYIPIFLFFNSKRKKPWYKSFDHVRFGIGIPLASAAPRL